MPQKRHTVDQIVAKLRKGDVELGKGKTHSSAVSAAASLMSIGVKGRLRRGCSWNQLWMLSRK